LKHKLLFKFTVVAHLNLVVITVKIVLHQSMNKNFKVIDLRKVMATLISAVGTSPMVVSEIIDELKKRGTQIDKVVLLVTQSPEINTAFYALALDLKWNYGIKIERIDLPFEDVKSQEDHDAFVRIAREVIEREKSKDKVIVSVAGGRKTMSVGMYKAGIEAGVEEIYHIIAEEIPGTHAGPLSLLREYATASLEEIYEGKVDPPESLKSRIYEEFHKPLTLHLIRV